MFMYIQNCVYAVDLLPGHFSFAFVFSMGIGWAICSSSTLLGACVCVCCFFFADFCCKESQGLQYINVNWDFSSSSHPFQVHSVCVCSSCERIFRGLCKSFFYFPASRHQFSCEVKRLPNRQSESRCLELNIALHFVYSIIPEKNNSIPILSEYSMYIILCRSSH